MNTTFESQSDFAQETNRAIVQLTEEGLQSILFGENNRFLLTRKTSEEDEAAQNQHTPIGDEGDYNIYAVSA